MNHVRFHGAMRPQRRRDNPHRRHSSEGTTKGYTVIVLIAAVATALAYLVRELILSWPV